MEYMEVFNGYLKDEISVTTADLKIKKMLPVLLESGLIKEYAKASLCRTYFQRYKQYNSGKIGPKDLLIFIRDFILFMGRFNFPRLITDVVERYGDELGVIVAQDGAIDVVDKCPKTLQDNRNFIQQVYELGTGEYSVHKESSGDAYLCRFTKFKNYRSLEQKIAVHSAIELPNDYTLMISLPTGGGKSLITQLLSAVEHKLTLVVVPTVSLAKDQYLQALSLLADEGAKSRVFCYRSDSNNDAIISGIKNKTARLIFTSPEAILKSERFNNELRKASQDKYLHNVVIDEAHIVPDWGVHFRPDFQIFSVVLNEMKKASEQYIRTYLLSATLSDDVVEVLFDLFGSNENNVQFRCDALRQEPRYMISENHNYEGRENDVIEMVKYLPKPLIVYVIEPATADRYCKKLNKLGFLNVHSYTGETSDRDRESLLESWKNNEFDIMIATSAFGMGVDKSNVRTIIHSCVPENLSRFYQEVGRAGRDGLPSLSVISYFMSRDDGRNDLSVAFGLVNKSILKPENIIIRLESILEDEKTIIDGEVVIADLNTVPKSFTSEEAKHAGMRNMCWNANTLLLLHRQGYIEIVEAKYDAVKKTYLFSFKIKDIDLITDSDKLTEAISEDRQKEYNMRVAGYHKMADLIHRPKVKCWGKHFVSLYPYAQPICKGCPVHPEGTSVKEDAICIRDKSIVNVEPSVPSVLLKRYIGTLNDLLVPIDDYDDVDIKVVIEKANKLNLGCVVIPDKYSELNTDGCLGITHSEFITIAKDIEWVFHNGILFLLSDDLAINNKIFEIAENGKFLKYKKVWCCKPSTRIVSKNRTLNEFLDCRSCSLSSL